jgi:hypothetical protein
MINRPNTSGNLSAEEVRAALDRMKLEIAGELGIDLRSGPKGNIPSRAAGDMVRRMIKQQERAMSLKDGRNR